MRLPGAAAGLRSCPSSGSGSSSTPSSSSPVDTLFVAVRAIQGFLAGLKEKDDVLAFADRYIPSAEFNELIGVTEQMALGERYKA